MSRQAPATAALLTTAALLATHQAQQVTQDFLKIGAQRVELEPVGENRTRGSGLYYYLPPRPQPGSTTQLEHSQLSKTGNRTPNGGTNLENLIIDKKQTGNKRRPSYQFELLDARVGPGTLEKLPLVMGDQEITPPSPDLSSPTLPPAKVAVIIEEERPHTEETPRSLQNVYKAGQQIAVASLPELHSPPYKIWKSVPGNQDVKFPDYLTAIYEFSHSNEKSDTRPVPTGEQLVGLDQFSAPTQPPPSSLVTTSHRDITQQLFPAILTPSGPAPNLYTEYPVYPEYMEYTGYTEYPEYPEYPEDTTAENGPADRDGVGVAGLPLPALSDDPLLNLLAGAGLALLLVNSLSPFDIINLELRHFRAKRAASGWSNNDGYDFNAMNVIQWISMLQEVYEKFDYNDLECQKRLICEVLKEEEYFGSVSRKMKNGFQLARYLEVLNMPDDFRELLDEYLDASERSTGAKECQEFFQCPYSLKESVKRNFSGNSL